MSERLQNILIGLTQAGITPTALPDAVRRTELALPPDAPVTIEQARLLGEGYRGPCPHYFSDAAASLSPAIPTARSKRKEKMNLSAAQQREIPPQLSPTERMTRAREIEKKAKAQA